MRPRPAGSTTADTQLYTVDTPGGLALAAVQAALPRTLGIEQTAASLASLFLDGARQDP